MPADAAPSFLLVPEIPAPGERLALAESEAHYLVRVCRARPGDHLTATDGRGTLATLRLIEAGSSATAEVEKKDTVAPGRAGWVLCGAPEGERADWLVEKLAELGASVFQPFASERDDWSTASRRLGRWRRLAAAALRQSRRRFLLDVRPVLPLAEAIESLPPGAARWLAHVSGPGPSPDSASRTAVGVIGPSGGLTEREFVWLDRAGFRRIRLSDGRLRTETAAVAWAAWWAAGGAGSDQAASEPEP